MERILDARRQVLNTYGRQNGDFPTLDRVICKIYGADPLVGDALRNLFSNNFIQIANNIRALHRELLDETLRNSASVTGLNAEFFQYGGRRHYNTHVMQGVYVQANMILNTITPVV